MRNFVLLLLLAGTTVLRAGDDPAIQNGDFSDGLAHWYGDVRTVADLDPSASFSGDGIAVKLRDRDWAKAQQDFHVPEPGNYKLHVTITPSSDLHFSDQYADYIDFPGKLEFKSSRATDASTGEWAIAVVDADGGALSTWTTPLTHPSGQQSYTFTVKGTDPSRQYVLYIGFPPGSGYVTLQHVSLIPAP